MNNSIYGYVRVSSKDQNEARQMNAMAEIKFRKSIFSWISNPGKILTDPSTND